MKTFELNGNVALSMSLHSLCRLFGGLILDVKRKAPFYFSDFKDGLNLQCVASFLFLYCACMSPVITFGGLLGEATEGRIVSTQTHSFVSVWSVRQSHVKNMFVMQNTAVMCVCVCVRVRLSLF